MADIGHLGFRDDFEAADFMLEQVGVAPVPGSSFYHRANLGLVSYQTWQILVEYPNPGRPG